MPRRARAVITFVAGAVFFSVIYGNIAQFVKNLYRAGTRYRARIEELREFAHFHRLSPSLRTKIYNYIEFQWSVTNGIDVDKIAAGLPAHLQVPHARSPPERPARSPSAPWGALC